MSFEWLEDRHLLATLLVNSPLDNVTAGDGLVTLREAIVAANNDTVTDLGYIGNEADTIQFDTTVFGTPKTIQLSLGQFVVNESLTINGPGRNLLTIDAQRNSRIFEVDESVDYPYAPRTTFAISDMTLANGSAAGDGGAIRLLSTKGIEINRCTIAGNTATGKGGAIFAPGRPAFVSGSSTFIWGPVKISSSTISGNSSGGAGGAVYARGSVQLTSSTVSGNQAVGPGGGVYVATSYHISHGIYLSTDGTATVSFSTISGNQSGGEGGGIWARDAFVNSSTISGSSATTGGGIRIRNIVRVNNSTITGNTAVGGAGGGIWNGNASPPYSPNVIPASVTLNASILAGNTASVDGPDLHPGTGNLQVASSLIGDNAGTPLVEAQTFDANGNLIGSAAGAGVINPLLAPLASNGGPTQTHALLVGSPALDAGDPAAVPGANEVPLYDQRGLPFTRVFDGDGTGGARIDMGAFERQQILNAPPVITSPPNVAIPEVRTFVMNVTAPDPDVPSQSITYSIVGGADQIWFSITSGGALSFVDPSDYDVPSDANSDNVYVVTVQASDGQGGTATRTINVTLLPVDEHSPVITSPDITVVPENSGAVMTVTATDADLPTQIVFSVVGGPDQSKLVITSGGQLYFSAGGNFELPTDANGDNEYVVTVQVSDQAGRTATQTITVIVIPVNESPPIITSPNIVFVPENTTFVRQVVATDPDLPAQEITFSLTNGGLDKSKFGITADGQLSFLTPPDFDMPTDSNGDNVYVVTVRASDDQGASSTQTLIVRVTKSAAAQLPGDYNLNGTVDAADFVVWRKNLGMAVTPFTGADGSGNGIVDQADYDAWRANFGNTGLGAGGESRIESQEPGADAEAMGAEFATANLRQGVGSGAVAHVAESLRDSVTSVSVTESEKQSYVEPGTTVTERLPYVIGAGLAGTRRENHALRLRLRDVPAERHDDAILAWLASRGVAERRDDGGAMSILIESESANALPDAVDAVIERLSLDI